MANFFESALDFEKFQLSKFWDELKSHPQRLLFGIDPLATGLQNLLGNSEFEPLVGQLGGATQQTFGEADAAGINTESSRQLTAVANVIAGAFGAKGLGNIGGGGAEGGFDPSQAIRAGNALSGAAGGGGGGQPANLTEELVAQQEVNQAQAALAEAQAAAAEAKSEQEQMEAQRLVATMAARLQQAQAALNAARTRRATG